MKRVRAGAVTVLDVRPSEEYDAGHIAGAISLPLEELKRRLPDLPQDRGVVAYCRGPYCVLSIQAVEMLRSEGFKAARIEEGIQDFCTMGFSIAENRDV